MYVRGSEVCDMNGYCIGHQCDAYWAEESNNHHNAHTMGGKNDENPQLH